MNNFTAQDGVKVGFGVLLMAVWIMMLWYKVPGSDDIIAFCKLGLTGLATHYLTSYSPPPAPGSTVITTTPPSTAGDAK